MFPLITVDQLAEKLDIKRRWIIDNWINSDDPVPHFIDGQKYFFEIEKLQWAQEKIAHHQRTYRG